MDIVKRSSPRSYGQFCGLARALDVVGDRWNLLIVRELLPGPQRYNELKSSLKGIATNLLAERLKSLEANGIIGRQLDNSSVLYTLTPWGQGLRETMEALGRWGAPLLATGRGEDSFQPRWLMLALPALMRGATAQTPLEIGFRVDDLLIVLRIDETGPNASIQPTQEPNTILSAPAEIITAMVAGQIEVNQAVAAGHLQGPEEVLHQAFTPERPTKANLPIKSSVPQL